MEEYGGIVNVVERVLNDTRGWSVWVGDSAGEIGMQTRWYRKRKVAVNVARHVVIRMGGLKIVGDGDETQEA